MNDVAPLRFPKRLDGSLSLAAWSFFDCLRGFVAASSFVLVSEEQTMRCHEVRQNLDLFIRQEVTPSARERIEVHLSACGKCREELARLRRLEKLLAAAPSPPVREGFAERVVEGARRKAMPGDANFSARRRLRKRLGRHVRIAAGTAAALAAGLLLGSYLGTHTWGGTPSTAVEQSDPLVASGLGQIVEPKGDSLAQAYLALTARGDG